jgi:hypothetical protein
VEVVRDHIASSRGSRLALFGSDLRLGRFRPHRRRRRPLAGEGAAEGFFHNLVIHPDNRYAISNARISILPQSPQPRLLEKLPFPRAGCLLALEAAWRRADDAARLIARSAASDRMVPANRCNRSIRKKNHIFILFSVRY